MKSLDRKVVTTLDEEPTCLLLGSDVVLTCSITGFPRPTICFRKQTQIIVPGMGDFERISNISYDQVHTIAYACEVNDRSQEGVHSALCVQFPDLFLSMNDSDPNC